MEREKFKSRLGFILISAGCAIGVGNVWRFPYIVGKNGGAIFVLIYLAFLILMGVPIMTMELALGRSSRKSMACSYKDLEKEGQKWHLQGYVAMVANYLLMMFYTTVAGWMVYYFYKTLKGDFTNVSSEVISGSFGALTSDPVAMSICTVIVIVAGFLVCSLGFQKGVESITKYMMLALLGIMGILAINSCFLEGGSVGLEFYLKPSIKALKKVGVMTAVVEAMNQAFFTLSLGIGSISIFGSYMDKERALLGESVTITVLDTFVAFVSGLIIFPACFAYNVPSTSGPELIFVTLPNIFNKMPGGRIWGALFFLFLIFAAFSTVIAVFENIICFAVDLFGISRKKSVAINLILMIILSMPCVFGFNLWSEITPFGVGSTIMDLEDFVVSNILLPAGALVLLFFCTTRYGWGFDNYLEEANTGKGAKVPRIIRPYMTFVVPVLIIFIFAQGVISKFF